MIIKYRHWLFFWVRTLDDYQHLYQKLCMNKLYSVDYINTAGFHLTRYFPLFVCRQTTPYECFYFNNFLTDIQIVPQLKTQLLVPMFLICLRGIFQADYLTTVNLKLGSLFILRVASFPNYTSNPQWRRIVIILMT